MTTYTTEGSAARAGTVEEFFPTPRSVIVQMVGPVQSRLMTSTFLEPSAGKGDILDVLTEVYRVEKGNVYAIEQNQELQFVLAGKGYRVIASDFLTFDEPYRVDVVLMNPPFSDGVDHLLKAWEVVAPGGVVVCLLNAENVRNPYSAKRKQVVELVRQHGRQVELGQAFKAAARPTPVEVVMIVLNKPEGERLGHLDGVQVDTEAPAQETAFSASPLAQRNMIEALVAQYNAAVALLKQQAELRAKLNFYMAGVREKHYSDKTPALNDQIGETKTLFWRHIFERTKLGSASTSKFQSEFEQMRQRNAHMAFTVENVMAVLTVLRDNYGSIIQRCIVDTFDAITALHEKNKVHTEGWKTNKSWRINRKIIVPWGVEYTTQLGWSYRYYKSDFYRDLDKACCFLTGIDYASLQRRDPAYGQPKLPAKTIEDAMREHIHGRNFSDSNPVAWDDPFDSEFFTIRVHKKGTVHLVFKDEALWTRFNQSAAEGKHWVGPGY